MDIADHPLSHHLLGLLVKRVAAILRPHLHHLAGLFSRFHHRFAFLNSVRERFLDIDVLAGLERRQEHGIVQMLGRGDDHGVDARVLQQIEVILVRLRRVAAHGLDTVFGARHMRCIGVAHGSYLRQVLAPGVKPVHQVVAARTNADPTDANGARSILCAENTGSGNCGHSRGLHKITAGEIILHALRI